MKMLRQFPGQRREFLRQRAFTLTELLVVIGVIIVLAGMIFSTLWRSKVKGYTVYSQNNLRQLATAYLGYELEMEKFMPYSKVEDGAWVDEIIKRDNYKKEVFFSPICNKNRGFGPGNSKTAWRRITPKSEYEYKHKY
jgi:type II secretory pathway pseudopilin PulG